SPYLLQHQFNPVDWYPWGTEAFERARREDRPVLLSVDSIYMQAVQAMTGHGGWPMTVFLTPDGVPFYGGTYFPPEDRHGMPGFPRLLQAVAEFYRDRRGEAANVGQELLERIRQSERVRAGGGPPTPAGLDTAPPGRPAEYDARPGGLGPGPQIPQPMRLAFLP